METLEFTGRSHLAADRQLFISYIVSHDGMFTMKWRNTFTQYEKRQPQKTDVKNKVETHTCCNTNKGGDKAMDSTAHAFYYNGNVCMLQGPICQLFNGQRDGVGCLNGSIPGYLWLHYPTHTGNKKNRLQWSKNKLPSLG